MTKHCSLKNDFHISSFRKKKKSTCGACGLELLKFVSRNVFKKWLFNIFSI